MSTLGHRPLVRTRDSLEDTEVPARFDILPSPEAALIPELICCRARNCRNWYVPSAENVHRCGECTVNAIVSHRKAVKRSADKLEVTLAEIDRNNALLNIETDRMCIKCKKIESLGATFGCFTSGKAKAYCNDCLGKKKARCDKQKMIDDNTKLPIPTPRHVQNSTHGPRARAASAGKSTRAPLALFAGYKFAPAAAHSLDVRNKYPLCKYYLVVCFIRTY